MPILNGAGSSALRASAAQLEGAQAAGAVTEDNSVLGNLARFLSRPMFAVHNVLQGDLVGAAKNLAQLQLDFYTGGFLNRNFSLASLFTETGDITTAEERASTADVLRTWGVDTPEKGSWAELGLNFVGDTLTDPLTYVTLGAGALGKRALTAAGRAVGGARLATALERTTLGTERLAQTALPAAEGLSSRALGAEKILGSALSTPAGKAAGLQAAEVAADDVFGRLLKDMDVPSEVRERLRAMGKTPSTATRDEALQAFEEAGAGRAPDLWGAPSQFTKAKVATEQAVHKATLEGRSMAGVNELGEFLRFTEFEHQANLLELGQQALEAQGLLHTRDALRFEIPFTKIATGPVTSPAVAALLGPLRGPTLGAIGMRTLPGKLYQWAPVDVQRWVDSASSKVWENAKAIFDKTLVGNAPPWLRELRRNLAGERVGREARYAFAVGHAFEGMDHATLEAMGRGGQEFERELWDLVRKDADPRRPLKQQVGHNHVDVPLDGRLDYMLEVLGINPASVKRPGWVDDAVTDSGVRSAWAKALAIGETLTLKAVQRDLPGADLTKVQRAFWAFHESMSVIPKELVELGVWSKAEGANLLYVPHQASYELQKFLSAAPHNDEFRKALRGVFERQREYRTIDDFRAALEAAAEKHGVPLPQGAVETNMAALMSRRLLSHARTVERWTLWNEAKRKGIRSQGSVVDTYVSNQLEVIPAREGVLSRVIGGGKFYQKVVPAEGQTLKQAMAELQAKGYEIEPIKGVPHFVRKWEGLNFWYKPALTIFAPSFHFRNAVSNAVVGVFDVDVGAAGVGGILRTIRDAPILQALKLWGPSEAGAMLKAIRSGDPAALSHLERLKIGDFSAAHVAQVAKEQVLSKFFTEHEVFDGIGKWQETMRAAGPGDGAKLSKILSGQDLLSRSPARVRAWRSAVRWPAAVASYVEDSARLNMYLSLVKKGLDPSEAARKVSRLLVDYGVQSPVERAIRDAIPFARYTIGTVPVVAEGLARRPRLFAPLGAALRQAQASPQVLPEGVQGRPAIPLGQDADGNPVYATQLGLPTDALSDVLSIAANPWVGGRRVLGAGLMPLIRAPLEQLTGTNFYYGDEVGAFRQAPRLGGLEASLPGVTTRVLPSGKEVQEIPGWVNHWLLGAMPWARVRSELDRLFDPRKGSGQWAMQFFTGVRTQTVDQRREIMRALERYLRDAVEQGDIGKVENFFRKGEVAPEVEKAMEAHGAMRRENSKAAKAARESGR